MTAKILIVCLFALVSLLPAVQWLTKVVPDQPLNENRSLAQKPDWSRTNLHDYLMGWQSWFNDRYAGRNFLIRLKTQIDYTVFSYSDKVHIGHDGWLFYREVLDVQKPAVERMTDSHHDQIVQNLKNLNDWLALRGIRLFIVDNELKDAFYPEELPSSVPTRPLAGRYHKLRQRVERESGAEYIDASRILHSLKAKRPVFHKTDFHWNDPAAFEVARALVDRMAALERPGTVGWRWDLAIESKPLSGGEAAFMPLLRPVTEQALFVRPTWTTPQRVYREKDGPFEFSLKHPADPGLLSGVVVYGDSFFDGIIRGGFAEHFKSVHRARFYKATIADTVRSLPPQTKFFVLQFIETSATALTLPFKLPPIETQTPPHSP